MDSRIAILGNNGTGKSTLLNLITGDLRPCEGTVSKHAALKLAKYSQHSADQLPYDKSPIEHFQSLYYEKYPDKDIMVKTVSACLSKITFNYYQIVLASSTGSIWSQRCPSNRTYQTSFRWAAKQVWYSVFHPVGSPYLNLSQSSIFSARDGASAYTAFGYADLSCFLAFIDYVVQMSPPIIWTWGRLTLWL